MNPGQPSNPKQPPAFFLSVQSVFMQMGVVPPYADGDCRVLSGAGVVAGADLFFAGERFMPDACPHEIFFRVVRNIFIII